MTLTRCFKAQVMAYAAGVAITVLTVLYYASFNNTRRLAMKNLYYIDSEETILTYSANSWNTKKDFAQRISEFNVRLDWVRRRTISERQRNRAWSNALFTRNTVDLLVPGNGETFTQSLSNFSITTVYLPWILNSDIDEVRLVWSSAAYASNLLVRRYYDWIGDKSLCDYVNNPGLESKWHSPLGVRKCRQDVHEWYNVTMLDPVYLKWKKVNENETRSGDNRLMFLGSPYRIPLHALVRLHFITDVVVTYAGDVINGQFKLVACGCDCDYSNVSKSNWFQQAIYNEVFVMSQQWGHQIFHGMLEHMPRVAPFVEFLTQNEQIKIHVWRTSGQLADQLELLGIRRSRLVSGDIRAGIAYVTKATECFQPDVQQTQLLNSRYRDYIRRNFPCEGQHRLVMIRRTGFTLSGHKRHIVQQDAVEKLVESAARDYNLTYTLYSDNPVPSLNETMRMFHSAVMVVGVHGAGESNVVFSVPGVFIVEISCNPPRGESYCYKHTAQVLGHRWHGVFATDGCQDAVNVEPSKVDLAVRQGLEMWTHMEDV